MKLWQKVFLGTFALFEVLFNASSFYLIEHNFNQNLLKEISRGLTEQQIIVTQIQTDWTYVSSANRQLNMTGGARDFLKNNGGRYTQYFDGGQVFIEILDSQDKPVYSNLSANISGTRGELPGLDAGGRKYIIRDVAGRPSLFVSSGLSLDGSSYKASYIRDISDVYNDKTSQINLFFKINIAITVVLALGLYALIWFLTRPVRSLNKSAQTIAGGDYTQRVDVVSKDEIGVLAENFNKMAEAVESKVAELEITAQNKQNFINHLTHELKTPLTAIIGYADFLRTAKYNEEVFFKALTYIYSEGRRLESLSFKLMDLILVGNDKPDMLQEDISALCAEVEDAVRPLLDKGQAELSATVAPHMILAERDLFKLLCTNLIDNAVKASPPGSRVFMRGFVLDDSQYALEITDEGGGIPEEDIEKIFEPFFVVDKVRSKSHHGAGLGLAICAEIVRLHRASIDVKSRVKAGTTVRIVFPI